jgi:hypothetical protein
MKHGFPKCILSMMYFYEETTLRAPRRIACQALTRQGEVLKHGWGDGPL